MKIDFAHTFLKLSNLKVRNCNVFGEPWYSSFDLILFHFGEKWKLPNAAVNVDKTSNFWLHFDERVWKIETPLSKNNS